MTQPSLKPQAQPNADGTRPFGVVLAGGGARGFAHAGILHVLEEEGLVPNAIVGVSMGAVVGVTYAHRLDWFEALLSVDLGGFPRPPTEGVAGDSLAVKRAFGYMQAAWSLLQGWGAPESSREAGRFVLDYLLGDATLADLRIPVSVCATDLVSGDRVVLDSGSATDAVYASSALAGILPPLPRAGALLADGVYSDVAPVDVARDMGAPLVLVMDPGQSAEGGALTNGLQAVMRAMEICHRRHSALRVDSGDFALRPVFRQTIDTLDFGRREECVQAGVECALQHLNEIRHLLLMPNDKGAT